MNNSTNLIAVFHEKHGDRYFFLPTKDDFKKVALKMVKERNEDGYYKLEDEPVKPKIPLETSSSYTPAIKEAIMRDWACYDRDNKKYLINKKYLENALNGDTQAAVNLLHARNNAEYECFTIEQAEIY